MKNRISVLTLGVSDLDYMTNWYSEMFGWTPGSSQQGSVVFNLDGLALALISEAKLAHDYYTWDEDRNARKFALTIGLGSEKEVDRKFYVLRQNGAVAIREPSRTLAGNYKASICDPEGNFLELAYHPELEFTRTDISLNEDVYD